MVKKEMIAQHETIDSVVRANQRKSWSAGRVKLLHLEPVPTLSESADQLLPTQPVHACTFPML
jgi:hypothetical protein